MYLESASMSLFAEEVILSEEKTSTEDKIKIMEGDFYDSILILHYSCTITLLFIWYVSFVDE